MSDKINFRELRNTDSKLLLEIYSDKEAMKYRGSKPMESEGDAKDFINNQKLSEGNILTIRKGVELKDDNKIIGSVMYRFNKAKSNECEIGYSIGRIYWGQGFGGEIVKLIIEKFKENPEINKLIAWSNKSNVASIKILKENGFEKVKQPKSQANCLFEKLLK